ncbi:Hsp20/alpha crystallin family protein [Mucilaginibacter paludis]|uniref:Heat shock protein Hsp20 n=1 Tax=Mucilaginibacter paludis DSM 18603 TaxID=714943 RepID=H1YJ17_9SPHI|nr:Hsp20/alpha crystallin family protein [Mucilaginibacter paludis]EHQ27712.1 heat shock protein Hsp20 [Mucilaginibacter paludis DSM 18603]
MSTLIKSNGTSPHGARMEDFWNTDKVFTGAAHADQWFPPVNIRDSKKTYELEIAAPGFEKEDFKITTENGLMTIIAETSDEKSEVNGNYARQEFSRAAFSRTFTLPDNVVEDNIKAHYKNGLLTVAMDKAFSCFSAKKEIVVE